MTTDKTHKRIKPIVILIAFAAILVLSLIVFFGCEFLKFLYGGKRITDVEIYKSGKYLEYAYGDSTIGFMPQYEDLTQFDTFRFEYTDSTTHNSVFHRFSSGFVLDVVYNDVMYQQEKQTLFERYDLSNILNGSDIVKTGQFKFYLLRNQTDNGTLKIIAFSDELTTVKYVVLEDIWDTNVIGCWEAISWNNIGYIGIEQTA